MKMIKPVLSALVALLPLVASAQRTLTLEECRQMALSGNKSLEQARTQVEMAGYDRKAALANYFPNVSATGAYMYNDKEISLVSDEMSAALTGVGTAVQGQLAQQVQALMQGVMTNPAAAMEYMQSPMWQTILGAMSQTDVSNALNAIGTQVDEALHLDIRNVYVGMVSVQQPLFTGGKILAANRIARLAEDLSRAQYDTEYQQILVDVDQAYWQIVSVANKKKLAESYAALLEQMEHNVNVGVEEGVATGSDALAIRVKKNEADMMVTKATNGLVLAKMLLCKQIGLDLGTDIVLADETLDTVPMPLMAPEKDMEQVYADRPELRSLDLAAQIYDRKVAVARADMLPTVALTANYLVSNPTLQKGFTHDWGGMMSAGVMVKIPLFHGFEALQKTRKAQAEASLYRSRYEDTRDLVTLQVTQLRRQLREAQERLLMAESDLDHAEENLRTATVGFEEGVLATDVALAAQTAWLQAHSELIDAGIEAQMISANLRKAEGDYDPIEMK